MRSPAFLAVALALVAPAVADSGPTPYSPTSVVGTELDPGTVLLQWAPGAEPADSFRVYGVEDGALTLLADTSGSDAPRLMTITVPGGFQTYAVSGVRAGAESAPVLVTKTLAAGCVHVQTGPPDISQRCTFDTPRPLAFHVPVR